MALKEEKKNASMIDLEQHVFNIEIVSHVFDTGILWNYDSVRVCGRLWLQNELIVLEKGFVKKMS